MTHHSYELSNLSLIALKAMRLLVQSIVTTRHEYCLQKQLPRCILRKYSGLFVKNLINTYEEVHLLANLRKLFYLIYFSIHYQIR